MFHEDRFSTIDRFPSGQPLPEIGHLAFKRDDLLMSGDGDLDRRN